MKKENEVLGPSKRTSPGYKSSRQSVYGTRASLKIIVLSEQSQVPPASPNGEYILFDVLHIKFCKHTNGLTETGSSSGLWLVKGKVGEGIIKRHGEVLGVCTYVFSLVTVLS